MGHAAHALAHPPPLHYERHRPEDSVLYQTLQAHWGSFVERADEQGGLPKFIVREFEAFLDCGILERGCALFACADCGATRLLAFSCKRRGFCPSCLGRRMSDVALNLVDHVLPHVPVRQWVCSLPYQLRYLLGYDRKLCAAVVHAIELEVMASYKRRAKQPPRRAAMKCCHERDPSW
jgi:hypothetical protein